MKKIFILHIIIAFLLIHPINLYSQRKLTEFSVKIPRPKEAFICSDGSGNLASVFHSNKQYEVNFLDPDFKVLQTSITPKVAEDKNQEIIGAILDKEQCTAYFYNSKLNGFSFLSASRAGGQAIYSRIKVLDKNEEFLNSFEMNGRFYILTVPKNSSNLKVMILNGKDLEEMTFDMGMPGFYAALAKQNERLNIKAQSEIGIEEISYDLENNIKSAYPEKKLYHFEDKVFMTFDEPGLTHFITVDIAEKKAEYKKLNFDLERGNNFKQKQGNSFLYKNRLFRSTISNEQLNITILDLDSMTLINSYNFYPNQEISILNGPMMQEGGNAIYTTDEKILKRSDQFFKRVLDGNLAIAANKIDSNKYELQIGSYEVFNTSSRNGFGGGPQISIGMGMGGMGMGGMGYPYGGFSGYPGSYGYNGFPGYYPNQTSTRQRIVYFKSLMEQEKFAHLPGGVPPNMKDKINEYEYRVFKNNVPEVLMIAPYSDNSVLLGYYVKGRRKFNIVEFKN